MGRKSKKEGMCVYEGFPDGTSGKEPACQWRKRKRHGFKSLGREDPRRRKWQPTPIVLPGESHGQRSLVGYSPQSCKESDTTEVTEHEHCFVTPGSQDLNGPNSSPDLQT